MKILKRILLVIGFIPAFIIGGIKWILTGEDLIVTVESFISYCTK